MQNRRLQKILFLFGLISAWEIVARSGLFPALLFPSFTAILNAFVVSVSSDALLQKTAYSLLIIAKGLLLSLLIVLVLSYLGITFDCIGNILETLVAIFDPLPGIALLPLAMLWFGISEMSILFILLHSIIWPLLLNAMTGFRAVPRIYLDAGRNFGLNQLQMVFEIMLPASLPYFISGLKIAWARSWRAMIAVEMVFGAAAGTAGGLGWHIYMTRYFADITATFAALLAIMMIGLMVEEVFFKGLERMTIKKWGMSR